MGQEQSTQNASSLGNQTTRKRYSQDIEIRKSPQLNKIEHEGLLRLRQTPFRNCIQIENNESSHPLFLESAQITLCDLLQTRLFTNRLFTQQDIEKMMQSIIYTMAYLQEHGIHYRDICTENIYYNEGHFKLLPNQLIPMTPYQVVLQQRQKVYRKNQQIFKQQEENDANSNFILLSPEMIIALRCQQPEIVDSDILHKGNVFIFGMVLLEVTTLLPSSECYDADNYDILDNIITQRLALVEQHYCEKIARIIGNMLDYDYSQRMDLVQLAIFLNRELNQTPKQSRLEHGAKQSRVFKGSSRGIMAKSRMVNSRTEKTKNTSQSQAKSLLPQNNKNAASRSNLVYMNYDENCDSSDQRNYSIPPNMKQQQHKNKVYLRDVPKYEKYQYQQEKNIRNQNISHNESSQSDAYQCNFNNRALKPHNNQQRQKFREAEQQQSKDNPYLKADPNVSKRSSYKYFPSVQNIEEDYVNIKKKNGSSYGKCSYPDQKNFTLHQSTESYGKKNTSKGSRAVQGNSNDHSINRIKQQIQKSRKLIQQFQKNEAVSIHSKPK